MNKCQKIVVIVISAVFLVIYLNSVRIFAFFNRGILSVPVLNEAEVTDICSGKEMVQQDWLFFYDGYPVTYDRNSGTIYIPQRIGEDVNWEGKLSAETGNLYFTEDEYWDKRNDAISEGHAFEIYQVREDAYSVYHVVFTGMPIMNLLAEKRVEELNNYGETREVNYGTVQVFDQYRSSVRFQSAECAFHERGGSSGFLPKKSYKLDLIDEKLSLLGMRKDDDWILNSLYDDAGLIHNKISYQVWGEIAAYNDVPNDDGTTMEFIEVFINNEYQGVYGLTERIDKKELSLGKNDKLYKCRADRIPEEHNYTNEMTDEMRPIFVLKYPDDYGDKDWEPIKKWVNYFLKEEFSTYEEGAALLNMENTLDYNLYCMLSGGVDNKRKNVFFAAEYQNDGTYVFKKVPWDTNATWGNIWLEWEESNNTLYDPDAYQSVDQWVTDMSVLYFYDDVKVSNMLYQRWIELRQNGVITPEKICEMVDEQFAYLHASGGYKRNYERWPNGTEYWKDEYIYEFINKRIAFLDGYYPQLCEDVVAPAIYEGVDYSGEFDARYYWEKNYETLSELYTFDRQTLLEHYVLYGKPFGLTGRRQKGD